MPNSSTSRPCHSRHHQPTTLNISKRRSRSIRRLLSVRHTTHKRIVPRPSTRTSHTTLLHTNRKSRFIAIQHNRSPAPTMDRRLFRHAGTPIRFRQYHLPLKFTQHRRLRTIQAHQEELQGDNRHNMLMNRTTRLHHMFLHRRLQPFQSDQARMPLLRRPRRRLTRRMGICTSHLPTIGLPLALHTLHSPRIQLVLRCLLDLDTRLATMAIIRTRLRSGCHETRAQPAPRDQRREHRKLRLAVFSGTPQAASCPNLPLTRSQTRMGRGTTD
jgi:hypothetical protein